MDAAYRAELRELNEFNVARFAAKLGQRVAELRAEFKTELHAGLHSLRSDLIKWMFLFWVGTALTVIGLVKF